MPLIPLSCPSCGANLTVESSNDAAICEFCNKPYVVKDAIVQNYINNVVNINAESVNIFTQRDFVIEGGVLKEYKGESIDVIIPNNVKAMATPTAWSDEKGVFENMMIESVHIPEGVEEIPLSCFRNCRHLKNVYLPTTLKIIGACAFMGCRKLEKITIPDSVTEIAHNAFDECDVLENFVSKYWFEAFDVAPIFEKKKKELEKLQLIEKRKQQNLCTYCGHEFSFFSGKCKYCGQPKNY